MADATPQLAPAAPPSAAASDGRATTTTDPLSIAYYCTGHGLGHATRCIEVCKHLVQRGHTVTMITGAPARVFLQEVGGACVCWYTLLASVGLQAPSTEQRNAYQPHQPLPTHSCVPSLSLSVLQSCTTPQVPSARFVLRKAVLDAGAKQLDPFTVDVRGSLELYQQTAVINREAMLAAEVQWLQSNHFDMVVSDVVPIVCAAAAAAGIPAVCVSNFSWGE